MGDAVIDLSQSAPDIAKALRQHLVVERAHVALSLKITRKVGDDFTGFESSASVTFSAAGLPRSAALAALFSVSGDVATKIFTDHVLMGFMTHGEATQRITDLTASYADLTERAVENGRR